MAEVMLLANFIATTIMVGIIWFVQCVHYPLLAAVPADNSVDIAIEVARQHQRRTGQVLALPMAIEGFSTLGLLISRPDAVSLVLPWLGALLLAVALGSTVLLSVPLHAKLVTNPTTDIARRLVVTNWPRTIAWTARGVICTTMVLQVVRS
jgi:hypothetical protein